MGVHTYLGEPNFKRNTDALRVECALAHAQSGVDSRRLLCSVLDRGKQTQGTCAYLLFQD